MKARLGALIVNVAVIHGAGLVLLGQHQAARTAHGPQAARAVQVRLTRAATNQAVAAPPAEPAILADAPHERPLEVADQPITAAQHTLAQQAASIEAAPQAEVEEYVPRPRLSVSPSATRPVIVPFPPEFDGSGRYTSVLALYIDEDGVVRRVRFDDATLPPSMKEAARQAFLQAHFQPGQVQGQAVKSLIHVQVVFDNTPITPDTSYTTM